jgi:beta-lactamase class A
MLLALLLAATMHAGYMAVDLDTGRTISQFANERFPMGSVYKLPIGIALLKRVDRGDFSLAKAYTIQPSEFSIGHSPIRDNAHGKPVTLTLGQLFEAMVSDSDNTAADFIQKLLGGGAAITKLAGVEGIRIDRTEKQISADIHATSVDAFNADPRDTATPAAMVELYRRLHRGEEGLSKASHELLMRTLETSRNPRRIAVRLPPGVKVAHKTGSMPGVFNDTALVTSPDGKHHIAMAIFINRARPDTSGGQAVIESLAKRFYDELTR